MFSKYEKSDAYILWEIYSWVPAVSFITIDDVITMTSLLLWTQSVSAVFYRPVFFLNCWVLSSIASYEKMNKFNKQTFLNVKHLLLFFERICHIHLSIYPNYRQACECLLNKWCWQLIASCINIFSTMSKLLASNMYCWSCETLISIHWIDLSVNVLTPFSNKRNE